CELFLQVVARRASPLRGREVCDDRLDQRIRRGVSLRLRQHTSPGEALLEQSPKPTRLGGCDGDTSHGHALHQKLPFLRGKIRFVRHVRYSSSYIFAGRSLRAIVGTTAGIVPAVVSVAPATGRATTLVRVGGKTVPPAFDH